MEKLNSPERRVKLWTVIGRCSVVLAIVFTVAAASIYYLPDLPREPRPDLGNIYPVRNHYTVIYWTKSELWAHRTISIAAVSLYGFALFIGGRLGLLKLRK